MSKIFGFSLGLGWQKQTQRCQNNFNPALHLNCCSLTQLRAMGQWWTIRLKSQLTTSCSNLNPTQKRRAGAQVTLPRVAKEKTALRVIVICNCELYKLVYILVFLILMCCIVTNSTDQMSFHMTKVCSIFSHIKPSWGTQRVARLPQFRCSDVF